ELPRPTPRSPLPAPPAGGRRPRARPPGGPRRPRLVPRRSCRPRRRSDLPHHHRGRRAQPAPGARPLDRPDPGRGRGADRCPLRTRRQRRRLRLRLRGDVRRGRQAAGWRRRGGDLRPDDGRRRADPGLVRRPRERAPRRDRRRGDGQRLADLPRHRWRPGLPRQRAGLPLGGSGGEVLGAFHGAPDPVL
ncbi:MAG: hypothetical protein AVDCRST_MAG59-1892, partial [uncultured Thermomicrobiales bacterium]